jgi:hypothetical protein
MPSTLIVTFSIGCPHPAPAVPRVAPRRRTGGQPRLWRRRQTQRA